MEMIDNDLYGKCKEISQKVEYYKKRLNDDSCRLEKYLGDLLFNSGYCLSPLINTKGKDFKNCNTVGDINVDLGFMKINFVEYKKTLEKCLDFKEQYVTLRIRNQINNFIEKTHERAVFFENHYNNNIKNNSEVPLEIKREYEEVIKDQKELLLLIENQK
jgi:hypothetical protein